MWRKSTFLHANLQTNTHLALRDLEWQRFRQHVLKVPQGLWISVLELGQKHA